MGEGAARRGSGGRHPWPCPGTRQVHPPRWTLGTYASSEVGREVGRALARRHRTVQNIWKKRLRISGTHSNQLQRKARNRRMDNVEQPVIAVFFAVKFNLKLCSGINF